MSRSVYLVVLGILALTMVSPALAANHLPLGVPNTSPWVYAALPNQHGMDDLELHNLSEGQVPLYIGNIEYPPLYESNSDVIPWQIWLVFVVLGVLGVFAAFVYPLPEGQVVGAIFGLMFSGYSFVLSAMIGFVDVSANPGWMPITVDQQAAAVMVNVIQPVYTVYNPPWLWVLVFGLVMFSIFGLLNAGYNMVTKIKERDFERREARRSKAWP